MLPSHSTFEQQSAPNAENGSSVILREEVDTSNLLKAKDSVRAAKIMIIDDEQLVIKVVKRYLSAEGYANFVAVSDSRLAIEKNLRRALPDVILSDINMPDVTGLDILRIRQKNPITNFDSGFDFVSQF